MNRPIQNLTAAFVFMLVGAAAAVSSATEATVENYGNTPIFVAIAHQQPSPTSLNYSAARRLIWRGHFSWRWDVDAAERNALGE